MDKLELYHLAIAVAVIRDEYIIRKQRRALRDLLEIAQTQSAAIDYLVDMMVKNEMPVDEFDLIALRNLDIEIITKEPS